MLTQCSRGLARASGPRREPGPSASPSPTANSRSGSGVPRPQGWRWCGGAAYSRCMATGLGQVRLERPDLTARILAGLEVGSVLVVAEAGFGKTSAVEQALASGGLDAAWVRCGDAAGDAGRLVSLLVDSVRAAVPGAADVLAERLATTREPVDPQRVVVALERELAPL